MKRRAYLLFSVALVLLGCVDSPEKKQPDIDIMGTWRLMETRAMAVMDYSAHQVFYEFKPDGILTVESDVRVMAGEYKYELLNGEYGSWREYTFFADLKIDDKTYGCYLAPDKMLLVDNPALDGPLIYFIRP